MQSNVSLSSLSQENYCEWPKLFYFCWAISTQIRFCLKTQSFCILEALKWRHLKHCWPHNSWLNSCLVSENVAFSRKRLREHPRWVLSITKNSQNSTDRPTNLCDFVLFVRAQCKKTAVVAIVINTAELFLLERKKTPFIRCWF